MEMNAMNHVQAERFTVPGDAVHKRLYKHSAHSRGHLSGRILNAPSRECLASQVTKLVRDRDHFSHMSKRKASPSVPRTCDE